MIYESYFLSLREKLIFFYVSINTVHMQVPPTQFLVSDFQRNWNSIYDIIQMKKSFVHTEEECDISAVFNQLYCPNPSYSSWPRRPPQRWAIKSPSAAMGIVPNELKFKSFYIHVNQWWQIFFGLCFKSSLFMKNMTLFSVARVTAKVWLALKYYK